MVQLRRILMATIFECKKCGRRYTYWLESNETNVCIYCKKKENRK